MSSRTFRDRGVITKIHVKNFSTYGEVTVEPGRNLNMIIGPNGTGKSTLVAAIALGLCGNIKVLGRSGSINQYVKTGCETATIEIHLQETETKTIKITRIFNSRNKSFWKINNNPVEENTVQELIKSFNIQVDNLCQFLPQDRVHAFSAMNGKQLLSSTEKSVGTAGLYEHHENLIKLRATHVNLEKCIDKMNEDFNVAKQKIQTLETAVVRINERRATKKRITALNQKRAWIIYDQSRRALTEAKKESNLVGTEIKMLKETLAPAEKNKKAKEAELQKLKNFQDEYNRKICTYEKTFKQILNDSSALNSDIKIIRDGTRHDIEEENNRETEINNAEIQKNKLANDLTAQIESVGTEAELTEKWHSLERQIGAKSKIMEDIASQQSLLRQRYDRYDRDIRKQQQQKRILEDVEAKRLELLQRTNPDAYRGVLWLRANKDKFSAPIYEPMMLNIQVKHEKYAKYFENIISNRDLVAFVCEDKSDMNLLFSCLRVEQNLVINVVHCDPTERYRSQPYIPIENLRKYGFEHYLVSLLEAPPTIMKQLITQYQIHNIPIGSNLVEDKGDEIPPQIGTYFSPNNGFFVRISKYTGDKSTKSARVYSNSMLSMIVDTEQINKINENLESLNEQRIVLLETLKPLDVALANETSAVTELHKEKKTIRANTQNLSALQARITVALSRVRTLENGRRNVEDIKSASKTKITEVINRQVSMYTKCNLIFEEALKINMEANKLSLELELLRRKILAESDASASLRTKLGAAQARYKDLENNLLPLKKQTEEFYAEALKGTDGISPQDPVRFKKYQTAFEKLGKTIEEIDIAIQTNRAKSRCYSEQSDSDNALNDYERTKKMVTTLATQIDDDTTKMEAIHNEMISKRDEWLPVLEAMVIRIHDNFSAHFSSLGCVGEVTLGRGSHELDFADYEIKIKVKFRDADELQEFNNQRQSGGERSVTTAIYMIALQELTKVPFRCVDEINQAMDASNERRIFDLIVKITSKPESSQYFLLTPKLLPNLSYSNYIRVHTVFNGPYLPPASSYNVIAHIKHIADQQRDH